MAQTTTVRALHDVGVAAWFGGSLMGAVGLNGASGDIADSRDRTLVASSGWARWAPVSAVAIGAHLVGGTALFLANRGRVAGRADVRTNAIVKAAVTGAALAATAYNGVLGAQIATAGEVSAKGATVPSVETPPDVAIAQQRQRILQWVTPALTGLIIVLGSQQGEQQRPAGRLVAATEALRRRRSALVPN